VTDAGGLEAYVAAIERHFRSWRGAEHVLSPRDFALARSFHDAGLPLAHVLVGVDRAFETDPRTSSLAACRRRVEELAGGTTPAAGAGSRPGGASLAPVAEALAGLEERLLELPPSARAAFAVVLGHLRALRDLVAVAARPNWDYLRAKLREIDEAVSEAAPQALDAAATAAVEREATRSTERHRGRVDEAALRGALARLVRARARERLRLPRVSVF
jgi:hypothetical protein